MSTEQNGTKQNGDRTVIGYTIARRFKDPERRIDDSWHPASYGIWPILEQAAKNLAELAAMEPLFEHIVVEIATFGWTPNDQLVTP